MNPVTMRGIHKVDRRRNEREPVGCCCHRPRLCRRSAPAAHGWFGLQKVNHCSHAWEFSSERLCVFRLGSWRNDARRQHVGRSCSPLGSRRVRLQFTAPRLRRLGRGIDTFPPVLLLNGQPAALGKHSAPPGGIRRIEGKPFRLPHQNRVSPRREIDSPSLAEPPQPHMSIAARMVGESVECPVQRSSPIGFEPGDSPVSFHWLFSSVSLMRSNDRPR